MEQHTFLVYTDDARGMCMSWPATPSLFAVAQGGAAGVAKWYAVNATNAMDAVNLVKRVREQGTESMLILPIFG